ncbi:DUF2637 domain-containing protein [Crossiella sp. CA-258035]|uniref:DUF2637 domain-containing protein n=1 Tax=Crossiella sp. CA-258035 TaxID=2981138 RepID=UPI0024BBF08C|nr:DUF2637 domain-containing protein [Crossiella sp. CA-258035]WHT21900.1 DUF2637 domain-containing protein [Crossiella sp. CA-258035]
MSIYVDYKAQRTTAAANAAVQVAEAKLRQAQVQAQIEQDTRDRKAAREAAAAQQRWLAKQARRQARRATLARVLAGLRQGVAANLGFLLGLIAMGAPIVLAWTGQGEAAMNTLGFGVLGLLMPVAVEGGAWYLAFLTHQALLAGRPTGLLRVATWVFALIAAGLNLGHGLAEANPTKGIGLALCSLFGPALWELTVISRQRALAGRSGAQIRTALWRRLRYPRLSWAAASIAAARGEGVTPEAAWEAAWMDRFGVGPAASRRDRRLGKAIVKASRKADRKAARSGAFMIVGGVILRADMATLAELSTVDSGTGYPAIVQQELSPAAADLLARTREAITVGELPVTPSAKAI